MDTRWDACTMDPHQWMRFVECHPGFAGYVQAIGVILTVAVAIFGPPLKLIYDRWSYRRARRRATVDFAYAALPEVETVVTGFDERLMRLKNPNVVSTPSLYAFLDEMGFVIPIVLDPQFWRADDVETERLAFLNRLADSLRAWNRLTFKYKSSPVHGVEGWRAMVAELIEQAGRVSCSARSTKDQIFAFGRPWRLTLRKRTAVEMNLRESP